MNRYESNSAMWRRMAESPWFLRLIAPLIMFGVMILFVRADVKNRQCVQACKVQGHADGFNVSGRSSGDHCVCVDHEGRNVDSRVQNQNSKQE